MQYAEPHIAHGMTKRTSRRNAKSRPEAFNNPTNPQSAQAAAMPNAAPATRNAGRPAGGNLRLPRQRRATPRPNAKSRPEAFNNPTNPQSAQAAAMPNAAPATRNAGRPAGGNLRFPRRRRATLRPNAKSRPEAFNNPTNPQSAQAAAMRKAAPVTRNAGRPAGGNLRFPRQRRATLRPNAKSRPEAFNNPTNPQSAQAAPMPNAAPKRSTIQRTAVKKRPLLIHNIPIRILKIPRASNPINARFLRPYLLPAIFRKFRQRLDNAQFQRSNHIRRIFIRKRRNQNVNVVRSDVERRYKPSFFGASL